MPNSPLDLIKASVGFNVADVRVIHMSEVAVQNFIQRRWWSPHLNARVDMQKYKSARRCWRTSLWTTGVGDVSPRTGTKYIIQAYKSSDFGSADFLPSLVQRRVCLEFGNGYIRFIYQGSPIL